MWQDSLSGLFAKTLALTQSQYMVQDGILYHMDSDSTLRMVAT